MFSFLSGLSRRLYERGNKKAAVQALERSLEELAAEQKEACSAMAASASGLKKAVDRQTELNRETTKALETFVVQESHRSARQVIQLGTQRA